MTGYYPGCTLHTTGKEYDLSVRAVFSALNIELNEVPDWTCCGATSAHGDNEVLSYALPLRNLVQAEKAGINRVVVPCAACYNTLCQADAAIAEDSGAGRKAADIVAETDGEYGRGVEVVHPLSVLSSDDVLIEIEKRADKRLSELKVVTYYGCLLARPAQRVAFEDSIWPQSMDTILTAMGAQVMKWSYRTDCCGGSLGISRPDLVTPLAGKLQSAADDADADMIITACPLCQSNLESKRAADYEGRWLPTMYFTELIGIALDVPRWRRWLSQHIVSPRSVLRAVGIR